MPNYEFEPIEKRGSSHPKPPAPPINGIPVIDRRFLLTGVTLTAVGITTGMLFKHSHEQVSNPTSRELILNQARKENASFNMTEVTLWSRYASENPLMLVTPSPASLTAAKARPERLIATSAQSLNSEKREKAVYLQQNRQKIRIDVVPGKEATQNNKLKTVMDTRMEFTPDKSDIRTVITIPEETLLRMSGQYQSEVLTHEIKHAQDMLQLISKIRSTDSSLKPEQVMRTADNLWRKSSGIYEARGYASQYHAYILDAGLTGYNGSPDENRLESLVGGFIHLGMDMNGSNEKWVQYVENVIEKSTVG